MVNVWLSSYLVHYKLNYSFLSQTKELREINTMLNKKSSRRLRKVQMLIVMCHLREMATWIHRKRIRDLTALHLWMVRYFDPLIPNVCLFCCCCCDLAFLATPSPQRLGSLSKDVFKQRTSTGREAFSLSLCLDAYNKFVLLNFFTLIETICPKIWLQSLPMNGKKFTSGWCAWLKNALLKLPNLFKGSDKLYTGYCVLLASPCLSFFLPLLCFFMISSPFASPLVSFCLLSSLHHHNV